MSPFDHFNSKLSSFPWPSLAGKKSSVASIVAMALHKDASAVYRPDQVKGESAIATRPSKMGGHTRTYSSAKTKYEIRRIAVVQHAILIKISFG